MDLPVLRCPVCSAAERHPRGSVAACCPVPMLNTKQLPKCGETVLAEQLHRALAAQTPSKEIKGVMSPVFLI